MKKLFNGLKNIGRKLVPQVIINLYHLIVANFFHLYYGRPANKLKVIGITGTDGKTTTCNILFEILKKSGFRVGLVTSINVKYFDYEAPTGYHVTSPDPQDIHKFLKDMVDKGVEYVVLETTSHALYQNRFGGIKYIGAIFTNITHEHLDQHGTYERYLSHKAKLISKVCPGGFIVLNKDDNSFHLLATNKNLINKELLTYGFDKTASIYSDSFVQNIDHTNFTLISNKFSIKKTALTTNLFGKHNVYNILGATTAALQINCKIEDIKATITKLPQFKGRWEVMQEKPFTIIVDFAHTPNALENVLTALNNIRNRTNQTSKIITVFGAASKRDTSKRPLMGKSASKYSDIIILTAEDPRGEDVNNINSTIAQGFESDFNLDNYFSISDRKEAIKKAIEIAKDGDYIIITGKGHGERMNLDGINEIPWSDQEVVNDYLK